MTDDKYVVQLSEYCFNVCETLKNTIKGKNLSDLSEPEKIVVDDLERCVDYFLSFPITVPNILSG